MSITSSYGKALSVETTALFVLAMLKSENPDLNILAEAVDFLLANRNYGRFASTQGTILSLKVLQQYAQLINTAQEEGTIQLLVDGKMMKEYEYQKNQKGKIHLTGWGNNLKEGKQTLSVQFKKTQNAIPYAIDLNWTTNTPTNDAQCSLALQTKLTKAKAKVGETVRLQTIVENIGKEAISSPIAKIGIPSGLSVQPWQLKELVEKEQVAFYELWHNYLVLYWRGMEHQDRYEINLDLKAEAPGYFEAPASSAYLYYTDEFKNWAQGAKVEVN